MVSDSSRRRAHRLRCGHHGDPSAGPRGRRRKPEGARHLARAGTTRPPAPVTITATGHEPAPSRPP